MKNLINNNQNTHTMKKPKVVLKNVKFHEGHEGQGINADVWINGVKCIHILDDGNGGCLDIDVLSYGAKDPDKIKNLVKDLNEYVDSLPEKPLDFGHGAIKDKEGNVRMFKTSLEDYLNELTYEFERQKERKKMEKRMQTAFVIGIPNADRYTYFNYKRPLSSMPKEYLQGRLDAIVKKHCTDGKIILNTNLQALGLTI